MTERQQLLAAHVEKHKERILSAERWLWTHPEAGYFEWQSNAYLSEQFESLGYTLTQAGNIPGFYTDVDTGKPGPTLCIMAELDALDIATHPESVNGMSHCCGHHAQCAALLGIAAALKEPGALDGLSGKIRLMAVPAEEMIQLESREQLRESGTIRYLAGKVEFMSRGYLDDVDLAFMVHGRNGFGKLDFGCACAYVGCLAKTFTFRGKAAHAGNAPHDGINAQYAAMMGLQACNNLRETFRDSDSIRFHPIMKGVTSAVNIIPDEMKLESYIRGKDLDAIHRENKKINRALAGAALSMGASLTLSDRPGSAPELHDQKLMRLAEQCCIDLVGENRVQFDYDRWITGSSDFGDVTCVMPGVQFQCMGAGGKAHGIDYTVEDPYALCVNSAKAQVFLLNALLENDAAAAKEIAAQYVPRFPSVKAYLASLDTVTLDKDAVRYDADGHVTIDYFND